MEKKLLIFTNPMFDRRFSCGISKLYNIFCYEAGYNLEIVNLEYLRRNIPESESLQRLVIAGGDGTIHQALNAIPQEALSNYLIGIIPGGTANEFAKSLNIPISLERAARLIIEPKKIYYYHIGYVNKKYRFVTGVLYGFATGILRLTPTIAKHLMGCQAFYLGIIRFLLTKTVREKQVIPKKFRINRKDMRTNFLLINNASLSSKDIGPDALEIEDKNLFSIIYLHSTMSWKDFMRLAWKNFVRFGVLADPGLYFEQRNNIHLEFDGTVEFLLDGEHYKFDSMLDVSYHGPPLKVISG